MQEFILQSVTLQTDRYNFIISVGIISPIRQNFQLATRYIGLNKWFIIYCKEVMVGKVTSIKKVNLNNAVYITIY